MSTSSASKMDDDIPNEYNLEDCNGLITTQLESLIMKFVDEGKDAEGATEVIVRTAKDLTDDFRGPLDIVFRQVTQSLLRNIPNCAENESRTRILSVLRIISFAIACLKSGDAEFMLPLSLLEYVFTFCTNAQIQLFVGEIRDLLTAVAAAAKHSLNPRQQGLCKLQMLKAALMCIRREHGGANAEFSGRLRVMLATALPVWDASGTNKKGQHNVTNLTKFADEEEFLRGLKENLQRRTPESAHLNMDFVQYRQFWQLQSHIGNPVIEDIKQSWNETRNAMDSVLRAFDATPADKGDRNLSLVNRFPKFLTDPGVLKLQFADIYWRRHILTQYLIFLYQIKTAGSDISEPRGDKSTWQSRRPFCEELFKPDGEGTGLQNRIHDILKKDKGGTAYSTYIREVLDAEDYWVLWKIRKGCENLECRPMQIPGADRPLKRRRVGGSDDIVIDGEVVETESKVAGGSDWRNRQESWAAIPRSERLKKLEDPSIKVVPPTSEFVNQLANEKEQSLEDDMKSCNDPKFVFRCLKALRMQNVHGLLSVRSRESSTALDLEKLIGST